MLNNKKFDNYFEDAQNLHTRLIIISNDEDVLNFANEHQNEIVNLFKQGGYSFTNTGKARCLKDYLSRNQFQLSTDGTISMEQILDEVDWSDVDGDNELAVSKLEDIIERMQEFIDDYRENDAFLPNPQQVVQRFASELQSLADDFDTANQEAPENSGDLYEPVNPDNMRYATYDDFASGDDLFESNFQKAKKLREMNE